MSDGITDMEIENDLSKAEDLEEVFDLTGIIDESKVDKVKAGINKLDMLLKRKNITPRNRTEIIRKVKSIIKSIGD